MFGRPFSKTRARGLVSVLACLVVLLSPAAADAMRVSPMVSEITDRGSGAVARIEVQNLSSARLPIEVRILALTYGPDGSVTETPADEDFLVLPPQASIGPNARQVMRVQYVGAEAITRSRAYYVEIRQLPVAFEPQGEGNQAQVQVVYHMRSFVVVTPRTGKPRVEVAAVEPAKAAPAEGGAERPVVRVTVRNTGPRHSMLGGVNWTLEGRDETGAPWRQEIRAEDAQAIIGMGYVAPDGARTFELPVNRPVSREGLKVRFTE